MNITDLPFNAFLGIEVTADGDELQLPDDSRFTNHVGTVHAGALYSLAEAASGSFLLSHPSVDVEKVGALLRESSIKYRRPASGRIRSQTRCSDEAIEQMHAALAKRGRAKLLIEVDLLDDEDQVVASANLDWFASHLPT